MKEFSERLQALIDGSRPLGRESDGAAAIRTRSLSSSTLLLTLLVLVITLCGV